MADQNAELLNYILNLDESLDTFFLRFLAFLMMNL